MKTAAGILFVLLLPLTAASQATTEKKVYKGSDGVKLPVVTREVKPQYTAAAREKKIQGIVEVAAVVEADGTVGNVTVTRSLDQKYGLDDAAVKAVRQWNFEPGTKDGKPVAVEVEIELTFTLK